MDAYTKVSRTAAFYKWSSTFQNVDGTIVGPVQSANGSGSYYNFQNRLDGYRNPNWRAQIRSAQSATTPMTGVKYTAQVSWVSATASWVFDANVNPNTSTKQGRYYTLDGYLQYPVPTSPISVPPGVTADVSNRCIRQFLSSAQSAISSFESGQDLGEYRETLESIHRPLGSLQTSLKSYLASLTKAKHKYKTPHSLRKVLADTYLEFRFGWLPLASDIADTIVKCQKHRFDLVPIKGYAKSKFDGAAGRQDFPVGFMRLGSNYADTYTYSQRIIGMIRTGANASGRVGLAQDLQLLPENWLPTAWDLLPYSWIADYFTNIGDIINALTFVTSRVAWMNKSTKSAFIREYGPMFDEATYTPSTGYSTIRLSKAVYGGKARFTQERVTRTALGEGDLIPTFQFRVPVSKYPYFNLAALLFSRAEKIVPFF